MLTLSRVSCQTVGEAAAHQKEAGKRKMEENDLENPTGENPYGLIGVKSVAFPGEWQGWGGGG